MSLETLVPLESMPKIERLGTFLDAVKTSVVSILDWFGPNLQPIPPDTCNFEEKLRRRIFTQEDRDRLWNQVKDVQFSKN